MARKKGSVRAGRIKKETKDQRISRRRSGLKGRKARAFDLARKMASITKRVQEGGRLSKRDARTVASFRKWKERHKAQRMRKLSKAQKQGIKKAQKAYTTSERSKAAIKGWKVRRKKYGDSGRADKASFKKAAETRAKNGGGKKSSAKTTKKAAKPKGKFIRKAKNLVKSIIKAAGKMTGRY